MSPNYELLFFSSELSEVVNILDFFDGQPVDLKGQLKKFKVNGGSSMSERPRTDEVRRCVAACSRVFSPTAEHTGTDLNLAFRTILERMALIKQRVGEKTFEQHRHAILVFTDGGSSFVSDASKEIGSDFFRLCALVIVQILLRPPCRSFCPLRCLQYGRFTSSHCGANKELGLHKLHSR